MKGVKEACCWEQLLKKINKKNSHNWDVITHGRRARLDEEGGCRRRVLAFVFVLPPSRAFQQYGVEVQPAETNCFFWCLCNGKLWNKTVKLHVTELFTLSSQFLQTSFHFNASHLLLSPFIMWRHLLPSRWFSLSSLISPHLVFFLYFYSPLPFPFSSSVTNFTFWIAHFLSAALPELLSTHHLRQPQRAGEKRKLTIHRRFKKKPGKVTG